MQTSVVPNMPTNLNMEQMTDSQYKKRKQKAKGEDEPLEMDPLEMSRTNDSNFGHIKTIDSQSQPKKRQNMNKT